jgi:phospholipase C
MSRRLYSAISLFVLLSILIGSSLVSPFTAASAIANIPTLTATPIRHLVVIFQENVSFDHYFASYPNATNPVSEPIFIPNPNTPSVNNLLSAGLLTNNPNSANPFRLDRSQAVTCDMNHNYSFEQQEYNGGLLNRFVKFSRPTFNNTADSCDPTQVMDYFDGNTVTALWNYAQHFAMSDNFYSTTFGPSLLGHLNLISGQTHGANLTNDDSRIVNGTVIGNKDPAFDDCSGVQYSKIAMKGKNIGDLMSGEGISWGWFSAGFKLPQSNNKADYGSHDKINCENRPSHKSTSNITNKDYYPLVEPFQYYNSTANPHHLPPSSAAMIGKTDQANHQYDLNDFWSAAESNNLPAVSFIKAATYQQGHPAISDPLEEQTFLVNTLNRLQKLPEWSTTAVIITYDDSDGWYDHVMPPIVSQSNDPKNDALIGKDGLCGHAPTGVYQDRCGYGPRNPLLIISPYSKINYVDHQITDHTSILRFVEDNWHLGRIGDQSLDTKAGSIMNMFNFSGDGHGADKLFLDPSNGTVRIS